MPVASVLATVLVDWKSNVVLTVLSFVFGAALIRTTEFISINTSAVESKRLQVELSELHKEVSSLHDAIMKLKEDEINACKGAPVQ